MIMNLLFLKLQQLTRCGTFCLPVASFLLAVPALATGNGPNGINIGIDFNWNNGPAGYTASFIASTTGTGATLNNDGGAVNSSTSTGNFALAYRIGGVPQTSVTSGGVYSAWTGTCDQNPSNSAPLTLFNCFNTNSFGQIFMASASGVLSGVTMPMTCLNPAGSPPTGLYALIYQILPNGLSIGATPLAQVPIDLSTCPTATNWTGKTFSASDFAAIPLNFSGVSVTAGTFYGVYFGGLVPGTQPPGTQLPAAPTVPTLSGWVTIALAAMLLATGGWRLRRRSLA